MHRIKVPGLKQIVQHKAIIWIEGDGNYSRLHFIRGQKHLSVETLKRFEEWLPYFIRSHKHALINPLYIARFNQQTPKVAQIVLRDGTVLKVSRRRIEAVKIRLNNFFVNSPFSSNEQKAGRT